MLILSGMGLIAVNFSYAQDSWLPKGIQAEEVDGVIHQVEYHYGSPLADSWQEMLAQQSVKFYPEDRVTVFPDPKFGLGSQIIIKRANQVAINDGGVEKTVRTWAKDIQGILAEQNITLGEKDVVEPVQDKTLAQLQTSERNLVARDNRDNVSSAPIIADIKITRVAETEVKETEGITYKTITKEDASLEKGIIKKEQVGKKGIKELTYNVRRENGQEVAKKLVKSEITREPQNEIIIKGTKVVSYGSGKATWYDWIGGMTAASNSLAYGTMVHVVSLENGKSVDVKIVDHGIQGDAIIDLSDVAFKQLSPLSKGTIQVRIEKL